MATEFVSNDNNNNNNNTATSLSSLLFSTSLNQPQSYQKNPGKWCIERIKNDQRKLQLELKRQLEPCEQ